MNDCIFCKIISGALPKALVYEDDIVMAFLDISPVNIGHTLVVPKTHYPDFISTPKDVLSHTVIQSQRIAAAVLSAFGYEGVNIGINNGSAAGQVVFHMHIHVMPRKASDGYQLWKGKKYAKGEMEAVAAKIMQAFV